MKLVNLPKEFAAASPIIREIQLYGYEAYFVGGSVRDALLKKPIHDVDIATSAYPEEVKQLFHRTIDVGIEHGTVLVLSGNDQYEITTFRTESSYQDFRRPDSVTFVRSLEEDLKRRDFTINALAMTLDGEIIDLFQGLKDLKKRTIRAVGNPHERFHEDALRMMRALRFASQLGFEIEEKTYNAIKEFHPLLAKISIERISIEFVKLLLGKDRNRAFTAFIQTGCFSYCPGLSHDSVGLTQFATLAKRQLTEERQAWALLVYMLGIAKGEISLFLKKWKLSNQMIHEVQQIVKGLTIRLNNDWTALDLFDLGLDRALAAEMLLFYFDKDSKLEETRERYHLLPIYDRKELAVSGKDLLAFFNKKPGKWLGSLIHSLEVAVVTGQVANEKASLFAYAKKRHSEE